MAERAVRIVIAVAGVTGAAPVVGLQPHAAAAEATTPLVAVNVDIDVPQPASPIDVGALPPRGVADSWESPGAPSPIAIRSQRFPEPALQLREAALLLPGAPFVQPPIADVAKGAPILAAGFASVAYPQDDNLTPPDPDLVVGSNHVIAVADRRIQTHDKSGAVLVGPTSFLAFVAETPGFLDNPF